MPICIHCSTPIESLYMRYGRDHIVLAPCTSALCSPNLASVNLAPESAVFADEYLEHDLTVVIIDLILAKPQAYRHLLFNRSSIFAMPSPRDSDPAKKKKKRVTAKWIAAELPAFLNKFLALSLVDAYIRWFYLCVQPPSLAATASSSSAQSGRVSARVGAWLQERLPMQAGIFFPSLFTPRATNVEGWETGVDADRAIGAVCSAAPLFAKKWVVEGEDDILPTLVSYGNVLAITLIEGLALHLAVGVLSWVATRHLLKSQPELPPTPTKAPASGGSIDKTTTAKPSSPSSSSKDPPADTTPSLQRQNFTDPLLACKAVLLSQLSPLILLTFVLMWSTKLTHSSSPRNSNHDRGWMVWILRTFLASLNAGVAIGTVLPNHHTKAKGKTWWPPLILGAAWTVQALTSYTLYSLLS